jgi:hypothetical protein
MLGVWRDPAVGKVSCFHGWHDEWSPTFAVKYSGGPVMDPLTVAAQVAPYIGSAVTAYGTAVLAKAKDAGADATVALGRRILQQVWHRTPHRPELEQAVNDAAAAPGDEDFQAALRVQVKKALLADPALTAELADLLSGSGVTLTASGEKSVAVQHNSGIISTGDDATIQR